MRYELRKLDNGWAAWDTEKNTPAAIGGNRQAGLDRQAASDLVDQLNGIERPCTTSTIHPPPEEDLGGGDICSLERQPSTDDDKPLD